MTTPCIVLVELLLYSKVPSMAVCGSIAALIGGVTVCTVADYGVGGSNALGLSMAIASAAISAWQQVLAGAQQRELQVSGMQLLHQCTPTAAAIMALLVPLVDRTGLGQAAPGPGTLLGYAWTAPAAAVVLGSSFLGLTVMLSAFCMIGLTSPLTYNIVGERRCGSRSGTGRGVHPLLPTCMPANRASGRP
jgi:solute carrier family 35 protein E3